MATLDAFASDAFSLTSLTDAINKRPFRPGRAGSLGIFSETGVPTTVIFIDEKDGKIELIPTTPRGGPATQFGHNPRTARSITIPHLAVEDTIYAEEVQGVRAFGSESELEGVQMKVNEVLGEAGESFDATLEHMMIGAIKGTVVDADGSTPIINLFTAFGVTQQTEIAFNLAVSANGALRNLVNTAIRRLEDEMGASLIQGYHAFCGSSFWDKFTANPEVREAFQREGSASDGVQGRFLRERTARRSIMFAGVEWEEYRGSVSGVSFVATDKCHIFPMVPGLFRVVYAPADFAETVNTIGLPRYAKQAPDSDFNRFVKIHMQSNPLVYCTRPRVLQQGKEGA